HFSFFLLTLAIIVVLPFFLPTTLPFLFTVAMALFLEDHLIFFFLTFFTFSFFFCPTFKVIFLLDSFGAVFALAGTAAPIRKTAASSIHNFNIVGFHLFIIITFLPH